MTDNRLIVALDFHNINDVKRLVHELGDSVSYYKVGMELFYSVGAEVVDFLKGSSKNIFLDLKLHDIPNTVAGGLCSLMNLGANILNIHAGGGYTMMKTAADRLKAEAEPIKIFVDDDNYKIFGLHFYNTENLKDFDSDFKKLLEADNENFN